MRAKPGLALALAASLAACATTGDSKPGAASGIDDPYPST
jgi:hypothetical protein